MFRRLVGKGDEERKSSGGKCAAMVWRRAQERGGAVTTADTRKAATIAVPSLCHESHDLDILSGTVSTRTLPPPTAAAGIAAALAHLVAQVVG